jgi:D-glycero-D-manno-heptose 1,7-bisphosphate phosphatase
MSVREQRYILIDRDGVVNQRAAHGCVRSWSEFEFLPHVLEALQLLSENNFTTLVMSHQPGIAQGMMTGHDLELLTRRVLLEVALSGGRIGKVYYCTHGVEDGCNCKSPRPGLLLRAKAEHYFYAPETYMISESIEDLAAAARIGCPGILIRRDAFLTGEFEERDSLKIASSLYDAVRRLVLGGESAPRLDAKPKATGELVLTLS